MSGTGLIRWCIAAVTTMAWLFWASPLTSAAAKPDDTFVLDELVRLYREVTFDHALHVSYAACVECHHHLTGEPPSNPACVSCHRSGTTAQPLACRACHPANRYAAATRSVRVREAGYHVDTLGLSGAYHLRCLGCHVSITAGPTGCRGCHDKNRDASRLEKPE